MKASCASLVARFIVAPTAVAASLTQASASPVSDLRLVALTGQPAPGAPGTAFAVFGPAEFDGTPSIGAASAVGFAALLSDGTAGFWIDRGSGPELLARSGSPAPGTEPGVVFSQRVSEAFLFRPPFLVPGQAVLRNTLSGPGVDFGNDVGIWRFTSAGLALVTREGVPIPGLQSVRLSTTSAMAVDDAGRAVFSALLAGAVVAGNDEAILRASTDSGLELLAREGNSAPGTGIGVVFATSSGTSAFLFVVENAVGDFLFQGDLHGPGTGTSDEALFFHGAAGTRLFVREGDAVPGLPGFVFREGSTAGFHPDDLSLTDDDHVAFAARVASASGVASALLTGTVDHLAPLVRPGEPAPGTGGRFDLLLSPVMNLHGEVVFLASLASGAFRPPLGLWSSSAGGLRAIALPDQPVTGQLDGALFQSIRSINGFNERGSVLFTADLTEPDGRTSFALLLANLAGEIQILARTGSTLAISRGDRRTVSQISARLGALSDTSRAAFELRFTDGSVAHLVADADRVLEAPSPTGLVSVEHVAPGTAGKGGLVPSISVGFPRAGGGGTLQVSSGTGGARGVLVLRTPDDPLHPDRFGTIAVGCGRALAHGGGLVVPSVLSGTPGAAGEGRFTMALPPVDSSLFGATLYVEAGYRDFDAPCGALSLTDIVRVQILPRER